MVELKTLRATLEKGFPQFHRTYQFFQYRFQFYGQTAALRRSEEKVDYFDIEFVSRQDATSALHLCKISGMKLAWAPSNLKEKRATGLAVVSYEPPRFDYDVYNETPSLPVPCNNPYPNKWIVPKPKHRAVAPKTEKKRKRSARDLSPERATAVYCPPDKVQPEPASPIPPFDYHFWPEFPEYPPTPVID